MKKTLLSVISFFYYLFFIHAQQAGNPDSTFGINGFVKTSVIPYNAHSSSAQKILLSSDGSTYIIFEVGGKFYITKRLNDGLPDLNYGNNSFSEPINLAFYQAAMTPDGKIIVAGYLTSGTSLDFALSRFDTNGNIDKTFGTSGIQTINFGISTIAVQSDNKIVVSFAEGFGFGIARFNENGSLDDTFNNNGKQLIEFNTNAVSSKVVLQKNGKIIVSGDVLTAKNYDFVICRINEDGSLDKSFSNDGIQITNLKSDKQGKGSEDIAQDAVIQSDGKIIVSGYTSIINDPDETAYDFAFARYNADGTLDITRIIDFNKSIDFARVVSIDPDDRLVVGGESYTTEAINFGALRFNIDGSLDNSFGDRGKLISNPGPGLNVNEYVNSMAIQQDGKIIVAGHADIAKPGFFDLIVTSYKADGTIDIPFGKEGKLTDLHLPGKTVFKSVAIQNDGKIVVVGSAWNNTNYDFAIARYNTDGKPDSTFNSYGTQLTDFGSNDDFANSVAIQADGKIVVAGTASTGPNTDFAVARYNSDGSLDNNFSENGKQVTDFGSYDYANSMAIQTDGKIIVAGYAGNINGDEDFALVRYNIDGTIDNEFSGGKILTDFSTSESSYDYANSIIIQNDGKLLVTGYTNIGKLSKIALVRYNTSGSLDKTFSDDGKQITVAGGYIDEAASASIQSDGKILVAGSAIFNDDSYSSSFLIARYNIDGILDKTFSDDGIQITSFGPNSIYFTGATSVAIQNDKKIIAAGYSNGNLALARYTANGSIDSSFSDDGIQITDIGKGINQINSIVLAENKLYAAGSSRYRDTTGILSRYVLDNENNNKPPFITFTIPSNETVYTGPAKIYLTAAAVDPDGTIKKVQFYNGSVLLHTEYNYPYFFPWMDVAVGNYSLSAKAIDNDGNTTTSNTINISVITDQVPEISITLPENKSIYGSPASIFINTMVSDKDGFIKRVDFYNGSVLLHTQYVSPFSFLWKDVPAGNYILTAKATDNNGMSATSVAVPVSVKDRVAMVKILSPLNNAVFTEHSSIKIRATASAINEVSKVEFYNGTTLLGTEYVSPYSFDWKNIAAGNYVITAKSIDKNAEVTTSDVVHISVTKNKPPSISLTNPAENEIFSGPVVIGLNADAKDPDGSISRVGFYANNFLLRTEYYYPYRYLWRDVQPGTYTLVAKAVDNSGAVSSSQTITITVTGATHLFSAARSNADNKIALNTPTNLNFKESPSLKLLPNPAHSSLHMTIGGRFAKPAEVFVFSSSGVMIKNIHSASANETLDVSSFIKGVYVIKVIAGDKVMYKKFVKL